MKYVFNPFTGKLDLTSAQTLADISAISDTTAKSLYTMPAGVDVEFEDSSNNTAFYIKESTRNTGLGTNNPQARLHVADGLSGTTYNQPAVATFETSSNTFINLMAKDNFISGFRFGSPSDSAGAFAYWGHDLGGMYIGTANSGNFLGFLSGNNVEVGRFDGNGNFVIGDTTASAKLHVVDTTEQLRLAYDSSNYTSLTIASNGGATLTSTGGTHLKIGDGATMSTVDARIAGSNTSRLFFYEGSNQRGRIESIGSTNEFNIRSNSGALGLNIDSAHDVNLVAGGGKVALGHSNPLDILDLGGALRFTEPVTFENLTGKLEARTYLDNNLGLALQGSGGSLVSSFAFFTPNGLRVLQQKAGTNHLSLQPTSNGNVGIGFDGSPSSLFEVRSTTGEQVRFSYDSSNDIYIQVDSTGKASFSLTGSSQVYKFIGGIEESKAITAVSSENEDTNSFTANITANSNISSSNYQGLTGKIAWSGSGDLVTDPTNVTTGLLGNFVMAGSGDVDFVSGSTGLMLLTGTGKVIKGVGASGVAILASGGEYEEAIGLNANVLDFTGGAGTLGTAIGLNVEDITAGGTNFAIRTGTGLVDLGDNLKLSLYGSGSETGTPTYGLAVDTNGNVIEIDAVSSGTYTPTLTGVSNVSSSTARQAQWSRVGNIVTVSGQIDVTATSNNTQTQIGISLPVASNFTTAYQLGGAGHTTNNGSQGHGASIEADSTNDRAEVDFYETHGGTDTLTYTFTYKVL